MATVTSSSSPSVAIPTMKAVHQRQDSKYAQLDLWNRITGDINTSLSSSPVDTPLASWSSGTSSSSLHPLCHSAPVSPRHSDEEFTKPRENVTEKKLLHEAVPRFAAAQHGRTLHHPNLKQPTLEQEEAHLVMLEEKRRLKHNSPQLKQQMNGWKNNNNMDKIINIEEPTEQQQQQELVDKLSKALLLGGANNANHIGNVTEKRDEYFPSPTSTLCFPDPTFYDNNYEPNTNIYDEDEVVVQDDFIGTCGFISPEPDNKQNHILQNNNNDIIVNNENKNNTNQSYGEIEPQTPTHSFVICSDTQLGISSKNREWETELEYSRRAIRMINAMDPPPRFVCVCGDLIDMEYTFEERKGYSDEMFGSKEECDAVQDEQNRDFQEVWSGLREDVAICCLCGNHDVGNRPTAASIQRYKDAFGDEYLSFWVNGTYNIVLNNVIFVDHSGCKDIFDKQLVWLEDRLKYAHEHDAKMIFVYGHHPWFLYDENESPDTLHGSSPFPQEWQDPSQPLPPDAGFPDAYFSIPKIYRDLALNLFKKYGVNASFCGHFHQNVVSKTSWGMDNIITAPLSVVFESSGKPKQEEENGRGIRVVNVRLHPNSDGESFEDGGDGNSTKRVRNGGSITHYFRPIES